MQNAMKFLICLKVLYRFQSKSWSSLVPVVRVLGTCSGLNSFSWHHGFGHLSSLCCCHARPFEHMNSLNPSMDIPRVAMLAGFSTPLTRLL